MKRHACLPALVLASALAVLAAACDTSQGATVSPLEASPGELSPHTIPAPKLQELNDRASFRSGGTYDWCDVFGCVSCPSTGCPPQESVIHCCNEVGQCVHVELATMCDPNDYVVICRWGTSNEDGTITCYG